MFLALSILDLAKPYLKTYCLGVYLGRLGGTWTASVRSGAARLLIGIECSRVRNSSWMYLTSFVATQVGVGLAAVQRKLPDCVVVGLQLYSARTFHVTPPNNHQHLRQYKPHRT